MNLTNGSQSCIAAANAGLYHAELCWANTIDTIFQLTGHRQLGADVVWQEGRKDGNGQITSVVGIAQSVLGVCVPEGAFQSYADVVFITPSPLHTHFTWSADFIRRPPPLPPSGKPECTCTSPNLRE